QYRSLARSLLSLSLSSLEWQQPRLLTYHTSLLFSSCSLVFPFRRDLFIRWLIKKIIWMLKCLCAFACPGFVEWELSIFAGERFGWLVAHPTLPHFLFSPF